MNVSAALDEVLGQVSKPSRLRAVQIVCTHGRELLAVYRLGGAGLAVRYRQAESVPLPPTAADISAAGGEVDMSVPHGGRVIVCTPQEYGVGRTVDDDPVDIRRYVETDCCTALVGSVWLGQLIADAGAARKARAVAPRVLR